MTCQQHDCTLEQSVGGVSAQSNPLLFLLRVLVERACKPPAYAVRLFELL